MPEANPVASAAFRIHGFYVIDSVLVVTLVELLHLHEDELQFVRHQLSRSRLHQPVAKKL